MTRIPYSPLAARILRRGRLVGLKGFLAALALVFTVTGLARQEANATERFVLGDCRDDAIQTMKRRIFDENNTPRPILFSRDVLHLSLCEGGNRSTSIGRIRNLLSTDYTVENREVVLNAGDQTTFARAARDACADRTPCRVEIYRRRNEPAPREIPFAKSGGLPFAQFLGHIGTEGHYEITGDAARTLPDTSWAGAALAILQDASRDADFYEWTNPSAHAQTKNDDKNGEIDTTKADTAKADFEEWSANLIRSATKACNRKGPEYPRDALYLLGYSLHGLQDLVFHEGITNAEHSYRDFHEKRGIDSSPADHYKEKRQLATQATRDYLDTMRKYLRTAAPNCWADMVAYDGNSHLYPHQRESFLGLADKGKDFGVGAYLSYRGLSSKVLKALKSNVPAERFFIKEHWLADRQVTLVNGFIDRIAARVENAEHRTTTFGSMLIGSLALSTGQAAKGKTGWEALSIMALAQTNTVPQRQSSAKRPLVFGQFTTTPNTRALSGDQSAIGSSTRPFLVGQARMGSQGISPDVQAKLQEAAMNSEGLRRFRHELEATSSARSFSTRVDGRAFADLEKLRALGALNVLDFRVLHDFNITVPATLGASLQPLQQVALMHYRNDIEPRLPPSIEQLIRQAGRLGPIQTPGSLEALKKKLGQTKAPIQIVSPGSPSPVSLNETVPSQGAVGGRLQAREGRLLRSFNPIGFLEVVMIVLEDASTCTGTLISAEIVLTAAHCVYGMQKEQITVYVPRFSSAALKSCQELLGRGVYTPCVEFMTVEVRAVRPHQHYDARTLDNDVAYVALATSVGDATTARVDFETSVPQRITMAGYGNTGFGRADPFALEVGWHSGMAISSVGGKIVWIYSKSRAHSATCEGDSGGPIYAGDYDGSRNFSNRRLYAIASSGTSAACDEFHVRQTVLSTVNIRAWICSEAELKAIIRECEPVRTSGLLSPARSELLR